MVSSPYRVGPTLSKVPSLDCSSIGYSILSLSVPEFSRLQPVLPDKACTVLSWTGHSSCHYTTRDAICFYISIEILT